MWYVMMYIDGVTNIHVTALTGDWAICSYGCTERSRAQANVDMLRQQAPENKYGIVYVG